MVRGWEKQLKAGIHKFEEREDEVRSRYDQVVQKYDDERSRTFKDMERKLEDVIRFVSTR